MAFRFVKASSVALGAFNIYIIQPQWLTAKELIPPGGVMLEANLTEPGFRFRAPQPRVQWVITPNRIAIETEHADVDCGNLMARLLDFLPETPLTAVGNNTHYQELQEGDEDLPHPGFPTEFPVVELLPGYTLKQRSFHVAVEKAGCVYNLQASLTVKRAELLTNAHCQVEHGGGKLAQGHARRFMEQRGLGIELAQHHLKVTFDV